MKFLGKYISKVWNELCKNEQYSCIYHFEDDIITKKKHKQLKSIKSTSHINNLLSPILSESLSESSSDLIGNCSSISNKTIPINNYITILSIPSIPYNWK
ncbi:hypothetical protein H8356DRAFT_1333251 [Neocallimastix lanati (nom. inval.)]|nr:hypothetical protein H8356DRAFT_1333251 [Neocallimastix sp. JGI-2020a]